MIDLDGEKIVLDEIYKSLAVYNHFSGYLAYKTHWIYNTFQGILEDGRKIGFFNCGGLSQTQSSRAHEDVIILDNKMIKLHPIVHKFEDKKDLSKPWYLKSYHYGKAKSRTINITFTPIIRDDVRLGAGLINYQHEILVGTYDGYFNDEDGNTIIFTNIRGYASYFYAHW